MVVNQNSTSGSKRPSSRASNNNNNASSKGSKAPSSSSSSSSATGIKSHSGVSAHPIHKNLREYPFKRKSYSDLAKKGKCKVLKQLLVQERTSLIPMEVATYTSIEAPPTLKPCKKYCDITGLEGKYTDPKTKLIYHSAEVYEWIQQISNSTSVVQGYLGLRQASTMLI